ncbi:type II and III secretion system protein family protein [Novosphingobium mathurense]|uniref:Pilus assembly protein CpaC n=1 Tax=Novosphingobium mathurense TaxID=428990 RepID=A0A1U6GZ33_9SPHN|nr:type II and III secretion system protein family protein [Novosphingobium mathurense]SLJ88789.1 pilus assembly protein CpaC [Novosphingobium mathurense]
MATNRTTRTALALALVAMSGAGLAGLADTARAQALTAGGLHAGTLEVPFNKSQVVSADRPIAKAMVGSSDIADILPVTDRSIYVLGKKMGTTSLTLYDNAGRVISIIDIAVGPDVEALSDQINELIPGSKIDARISNDSVVLTGMVNSAGAADRAAQLAKAYAGDKVINLVTMGSSQQVMLEVRFAEVNRTAGKDIGVSGFVNSKGGSFSSAIGAGAQLVPNEVTTTTTIPTAGGGTTTITNTSNAGILQLSAITDTFGIFRKAFSLGGLNIDATLNALETRGLAKTLAQPTLIALSGEKASFLAGGEFPVPVAQQSSAGGGNGNQAITVEFKPFGVSLGFTPTVLGDKTISLIVEPEVSALDPTASITVGNIVIPGLRTRRASTTLELRDGESFAIAGLLQKDFQTTISQVPILGSLPIIGSLFRSSGFKKGETELLIVVTPRLVAPIKPSQVRLPTDRVADPGELNTFLLGQPYSPQPVAPAVPTEGQSGTQDKGDGYEY